MVEIKQKIQEIEYRILKIIACGKFFGGQNNSDWICGDFLEKETDEEGIPLGECYFCSDCHKKSEEILKLWEQREKEILEIINNLKMFNKYSITYGSTKVSVKEIKEGLKKEIQTRRC
ncbi:MAG TPA: hypothetical protein VGB37_12775 [Candidatus Lokiarchaeia archaeon]